MRTIIAKVKQYLRKLIITSPTATIIVALSVPVLVVVQLQIRNSHLLNSILLNPLQLQKSHTIIVIFLLFPITAETFGNRQRLMLNFFGLMYYRYKHNAMR
jgi:hypothetical protein